MSLLEKSFFTSPKQREKVLHSIQTKTARFVDRYKYPLMFGGYCALSLAGIGFLDYKIFTATTKEHVDLLNQALAVSTTVFSISGAELALNAK